MEGDRKRKAGPIIIDFWGTIFDDDEPPSVVVIKAAAEKSKPQAEPEMDGGEDDEYYTKSSDQDLGERIKRMKSMLTGNVISLKDGGEKLRASLEKLEVEFERRKSVKIDEKLKKATPLADESTCFGTTYGLPNGASPTIPDSQSNFASYFCSKLDANRGHGKTNAFREELSSLNHCDKKNPRPRWQCPSLRAHKTGSSSKQLPFKSPSHLTVSIDKPQQSDGERSKSRSSTPSPRLSDGDISGFFRKRENAPQFQHSSRSRRHSKTVVLLEDEELEDDVSDQVDHSIKETCIYYPSRDDSESIEIHYSDLECLSPESYLSSNIMNFYIRYLQKPTSPTATKRCDYHFFNTYFYKKLRQDVLNKCDREVPFVKFRRWWKGVNIFEKAYILLPIHENLHWSLVIICIPDKESELNPIMLHLDSLGMHNSGIIFRDVKNFLIEEWKFLRQEDVVPEVPIADKVWDRLSRRIDETVIEVPQQKNEYDCGLFVLFFMERFIDEAPERLKKEDLEMFGRQWFRPEEASSLRRKIKDLLNEEFKNANKTVYDLDP